MDALHDLIGEGRPTPTAQQVAERAGVGLRSVFRHFSDMETLYAAMDARVRAEVTPLFETAPPEGDLRRRARALVAHRVSLYERIAPWKRSGNAHRWRSPFLRERHGAFVRQLRADLARWLPELERAPEPLAHALELATSFEAWDRLRGEQRLSRERAQDALAHVVLALVDGLRPRRRR